MSVAVCAASTRISASEDDLVGVASEPVEVVLRLVPHFLQNRAPVLTGAWQVEQSSSSFYPHCSQNAESAGFSVPYFEQRIGLRN
jgi:hypothetical protein